MVKSIDWSGIKSFNTIIMLRFKWMTRVTIMDYIFDIWNLRNLLNLNNGVKQILIKYIPFTICIATSNKDKVEELNYCLATWDEKLTITMSCCAQRSLHSSCIWCQTFRFFFMFFRSFLLLFSLIFYCVVAVKNLHKSQSQKS